MKILVTGAAGFIGFHVAQRLLAEGHWVLGIDNLNDYYDVRLKIARLDQLQSHSQFSFLKLDVADRDAVTTLFSKNRLRAVIHLAAQAGVRHSLNNPHAYVDSNLSGFINILEGCRHTQCCHLVYASSSSVYGANATVPFSESERVDQPISLYAATKKANELMAYTYSHLYGLPTTGLRFFTVYGPWGRPDMAYFSFTKSILDGNVIDLYHQGKARRDFTYIDDIVDGILGVMLRPPAESAGNRNTVVQEPTETPYRILNIGNSEPVELEEFVQILERHLGMRAKKRYLPPQPGDVLATFANVDKLKQLTGIAPSTSLEAGLERFIDWYLAYHQIQRNQYGTDTNFHIVTDRSVALR